MTNFIITGTDTDIGKTVFSAMLMRALHDAGQRVSYWKPVQSGLDGIVDTRMVQKLSALDDSQFLEEAYVLSEPLSPHRSAEIDGTQIEAGKLEMPATDGQLIIEGAGGLMVPLTRKHLYINQFKRWQTPVILCARAGLGTINHTLLSLEALWARDIPIHGLVFIGSGNQDNIDTIAHMSGEKILGWMPWIEDLSAETLAGQFKHHFNINDFTS